MKKIGYLFVIVFSSACVTTGNMKKGYVDPTGVQTIDESGGTGSSAQGTPVEKLKTQVAVLQGQLEEMEALHKQEVEAFNEQIKSLSEENSQLKDKLEIKSKSSTRSDAKRAASLLWKAAVKDINAGSYSKAIPLLKQIIDSYPKDTHVYYAHVATAMSLYAMKKYRSAAGAFAYVTKTYPGNKNIEMAWYGQGASLYKMLKGKESLLFFKQVASRWPKTPEGLSASRIMSNKAQPPSDLFLAFSGWLREAPSS